MAYADAAGTRIAYDVSGSGPDLLFLHAGIANRTMWQPQVEAFCDRFRVITPDIRGFGDTQIGAEPFSRRDDLAAVMDAIGATNASIVGCSVGERHRPPSQPRGDRCIQRDVGHLPSRLGKHQTRRLRLHDAGSRH